MYIKLHEVYNPLHCTCTLLKFSILDYKDQCTCTQPCVHIVSYREEPSESDDSCRVLAETGESGLKEIVTVASLTHANAILHPVLW